MSTAIAGLLGVVAGSVVTGGIQSLIARSDRRLSGRVSARLLHSTVIRAVAAIQFVHEQHAWEAAPSNWAYVAAAWQEHRVSLARVLSTADFLVVTNWFSLAEATIHEHALAIATDPPTAPNAVQLRSLEWTDTVGQQVNEILYAASRAWWDRSTVALPPDPPDADD